MATIFQAARKSPSVAFKNPGDQVAGRIVDLSEYQIRDFETREPKFYPNTGKPIMGVRLTLETIPGDETSQVRAVRAGRWFTRERFSSPQYRTRCADRISLGPCSYYAAS